MGKVTAPPKRRGRPSLSDEQRLKPIQVRLPAELLERARNIGEGNLSEGIRRAIEAFKDG